MSTVPPPRPQVADPVARNIARANLLRRLAKVESPAPRIGRFAVLEKLGEGAHGVVYAAFDPQLDRRVALKLLRREGGQAQARLLQEARALARLSHPNVVAVHEVGETDGTVFLAMEYIDGTTLDRWLDEEHPAKAVIDMVIAAGRGLVEAHARGLTHRDFKPSNVMVGVDGRARVTDFGVAHVAAESSVTPDADDLEATVTQTGTVVGTPAYMAPEQHDGRRADALSDQYSFCLTAWEAVLGRHPLATNGRFGGPKALLEAKLSGPAQWPTPTASRRIVQALRRGLCPDPAERWPSMRALLDALSSATATHRRWPWIAAGTGVAAAALVSWSVADPAPDPPCGDPSIRLEGAWDDTTRAGVEAAFRAVGPSYADAAWTRARSNLDGYAADWVSMARETCEATRVHGDQPPAVMDMRMTCLQQARVDLSAVAKVLLSADADVVRSAHDIVGSLPPLARCEDLGALMDGVQAPPPAEADAVDRARALLADANAEQLAGRFDSATQSVEAARGALAKTQYGPIQTELALYDGMVRERLSDYAGSEAALRTALKSASAWSQRDHAFEASALLVLVVGQRLGEVEQGLRYLDVAEGLAQGEPDRLAALQSNVAELFQRAGRYDDAIAEARRALANADNATEMAAGSRAKIRAKLGEYLYSRGEHAQAEIELRAAVLEFEGALGPEHPDAAGIGTILGLAIFGQGRYEEAEAVFRRAATTTEKALGPDHLNTVTVWSNVGLALILQGRHAEARPLFLRAVVAYETVLGPDHPDVAQARYNYASTLQAEGKLEAGRDEFERVLELQREALGPKHPNVGMTLTNLANIHCSLGDLERSDAAYEAALANTRENLGAGHANALAIRSHRVRCQVKHGRNGLAQENELREIVEGRMRVLGPDHLDVAQSRYALATLLLDRGDAAEALSEAERVWAIQSAGGTKTRFEAQYAWLLSQALTTAKREPERARSLAEQARDGFKEMGAQWEEDAERVSDWLGD